MIQQLAIEHIQMLWDTGLFAKSPLTNKDNWPVLVESEASKGWALTKDGVLLGAGGVITISPGVGEVWLAPLPDLVTKPKQLLVTVLLMIDRMKKMSFHRLQMLIAADDDRLKSWARHLGFSCEGRMLKYSPDKKDMIRYGLIWD